MDAPTTPKGGKRMLKPCPSTSERVHAPETELRRAETVRRTAARAAGLAAYHYFFLDAGPASRAAYLAAIEAESEAEALLQELRGNA